MNIEYTFYSIVQSWKVYFILITRVGSYNCWWSCVVIGVGKVWFNLLISLKNVRIVAGSFVVEVKVVLVFRVEENEIKNIKIKHQKFKNRPRKWFALLVHSSSTYFSISAMFVTPSNFRFKVVTRTMFVSLGKMFVVASSISKFPGSFSRHSSVPKCLPRVIKDVLLMQKACPIINYHIKLFPSSWVVSLETVLHAHRSMRDSYECQH